jgi:hypothetical protein
MRTILWHSALEFLLTFVLLFGVVTIVRWVIGPSVVARTIPHIHLQVLIIGTAVGLLITGLILSPPGRASGGHVNPAISLAMWRFGSFPRLGQRSRTAPGVLRRTPASRQLSDRPAVRHRDAQHVRHRAHHRALPERAPAATIRTDRACRP